MTYLSENLKIFQRVREGKCVHILALGSSSTEHFMVGTHWFDLVEIGFMHTFRHWTEDRKSVYTTQLCLNAGTSNHTTGELLARFQRDVAPFQPDLVILTCGFNDANPNRNVSLEEFRENLEFLRAKVEELEGELLFQMPCAPDAELLQQTHPEWNAAIPSYMQVMREVAGAYLHDNFSRWERLRIQAPELYRLLMRDSMHVNPEGSAVMGLDLARQLGLSIPTENSQWLRAPLFAQKCLDLLSRC